MNPKAKRTRGWIAWVGFSDGKPAVNRVSDEYCDMDSRGRWPRCLEHHVFLKKADAKKRYDDARRVRIIEEAKPLAVKPKRKAKRRKGAK